MIACFPQLVEGAESVGGVHDVALIAHGEVLNVETAAAVVSRSP